MRGVNKRMAVETSVEVAIINIIKQPPCNCFVLIRRSANEIGSDVVKQTIIIKPHHLNSPLETKAIGNAYVCNIPTLDNRIHCKALTFRLGLQYTKAADLRLLQILPRKVRIVVKNRTP